MSENKQPNGVVPGNVVIIMIISLIVGCGIESLSKTAYGGWITVFSISGVLLLIWIVLHSNPKIARFVKSFYDIRTRVERQKEREDLCKELGLETPLEKQSRKKKEKVETDQLNEQKKLTEEEQRQENARIKFEEDTRNRKKDIEDAISNGYREKNISDDYKLVKLEDWYFDLDIKFNKVRSDIKGQITLLADQQLEAEQEQAITTEKKNRQLLIHGGKIDYNFDGMILGERLPLDDSGEVYFNRPFEAMDKEMREALSTPEYQRLSAFEARLDPKKHNAIVQFCYNRDHGEVEEDSRASISVDFDYEEESDTEGESGVRSEEGFDIEVKK